MSLYHKLYNLDLLANIKIEYYIKIIYPEKLTFYSPSEFKKKNGYLTYKNMMDRNEFNKMKYYIFICCNTFNKKLPKCLTFYIYKFFVD